MKPGMLNSPSFGFAGALAGLAAAVADAAPDWLLLPAFVGPSTARSPDPISGERATEKNRSI